MIYYKKISKIHLITTFEISNNFNNVYYYIVKK